MEQVELFLVFTEPLEQAEINYMVTGSVASMLYGIPRFTHDLDLVLELPIQKIQKVTSAFPITDFYCPPREVLLIEGNRQCHGNFNLIHYNSGFKADIYLHQNDELQNWALARKTRIEISEGKGIWVAPPEYVIVRKLEYYREGSSEKHRADIVGMLEVSGDTIQLEDIQEWAQKRDLQNQWQEVKQLWKKR